MWGERGTKEMVERNIDINDADDADGDFVLISNTHLVYEINLNPNYFYLFSSPSYQRPQNCISGGLAMLYIFNVQDDVIQKRGRFVSGDDGNNALRRNY